MVQLDRGRGGSFSCAGPHSCVTGIPVRPSLTAPYFRPGRIDSGFARPGDQRRLLQQKRGRCVAGAASRTLILIGVSAASRAELEEVLKVEMERGSALRLTSFQFHGNVTGRPAGKDRYLVVAIPRLY